MPRKRKPPTEPYNTGRATTQTAPNQPYGQRGEQERALQAVPIQARAAPDPPPVQLSGETGPGGIPIEILNAAKAAQSSNGGLLNHPTARPDEPITAGLTTGPGPGPEALGPDDPDLAALKNYLPMLELAAAQPTASASTRNLVRRLRGAMPPV